MPLSIKTALGYKLVYNAWHKIAGTWVKLPQAYYKSGYVWKTIHIGLTTFIFTRTITGTVYNYNLRSEAILAGWDGNSPILATISLVNATVASSLVGYSFSTGITFPDGSSLTLNIDTNSKIIGRGGRGGTGAGYGVPVALAGGDGFPAVLITIPTTLNSTGIIGGGGGGGAGGGHAQDYDPHDGTSLYASGGGGGGGTGLGTAGIGGMSYIGPDFGPLLYPSDNGTAGSLVAGGLGGTSAIVDCYTVWVANNYLFSGGYGGDGGLLASSGTQNAFTSASFNDQGYSIVPYPASAAGVGGKSIIGFSFVTVLSLGTLYGATA